MGLKKNSLIKTKGLPIILDERAMIISDGEIIDIKSKYITYDVIITLKGDQIIIGDFINEKTQYLAKNEKSYDEKDLIVGQEKIRDFKLKNIINGSK